MTWHLLIPYPGAGCPWQGRLHLLQTREEVEANSETTGSAVWEVETVEVRAGDVDTTAAYEVAGEVEDGVAAAGAAAGIKEGEAEAALAAKEAWWRAARSRPFATSAGLRWRLPA